MQRALQQLLNFVNIRAKDWTKQKLLERMSAAKSKNKNKTKEEGYKKWERRVGTLMTMLSDYLS